MDRSMVRRPLALCCLGFAFGILMEHYEKSGQAILYMLPALLFFMIGESKKTGDGERLHRQRWRRMAAPAAALLVMSFGLGCLHMRLEAQKTGTLWRHEGQTIVLWGEGMSAEDKGDYCKVVVRGIWAAPMERVKESPPEILPGKGGRFGQSPAQGGEGPKAEGKRPEKEGQSPAQGGEGLAVVPLREKILLTLSGRPEDLGLSSFSQLVGKRIRVKGVISLPEGRRNPGGFDYRLYLRGKGIFVTMKGGEGRPEVSEKALSPWLHRLALARGDFARRVSRTCREDVGGLILSMLFGDKSVLDEDLYEAFQKNGAAHLLAVSGIHVSMVAIYAGKLVGRRRDLWPSLVVMLFLLVYAALAGFSPSVMRAALMAGMSMTAILFRRGCDTYNAGAASAGILLIGQPYRLFDLGFQLSFLCLLSLAVVLPWVRIKGRGLADRLKKQWFLKAVDLLSPLLVVQGMMIPATAYFFYFFSWSSFFLNPLLIPLAGLIVPVAAVLFPLSFLPGGVGELIFQLGMNAAGAPAGLMLLCVNAFSQAGGGSFSVTSPPLGAFLAFYLLVFYFCSESRHILLRRGFGKTAAALAVLLLVFASAFPYSIGSADAPHLLSRRIYPMVFVDVGQGDCLHLRGPKGKNVLIDGGGSPYYNVGKKILAPYLLKNGVRKIDLALVTHLHQDHYGGLLELAEELPVERLGLYEANALQEGRIRRDFRGKDGKGRIPQITYLKKGDRIDLGEDVFIQVLAPEKKTAAEYREAIAKEADENENCLVFLVSFHGLRVLVTGDMGFPGEERLLAAYPQGQEAADGRDGQGNSDPKAHILKVGHHGSRYSTSEAFLQAVSPSAAVIQVGKNNFGHPGGNVIELFKNYGIMVFRTDRQGAIVVKEVASGGAVLSDVLEEKIWHIRTQKRRSMPTRHSKGI